MNKIYMYACVDVYVYWLKVDFSIFLNGYLLYLLRGGLSLNPGLVSDS